MKKKRIIKSTIIALLTFLTVYVYNFINSPEDMYAINYKIGALFYKQGNYSTAIKLFKIAENNARKFKTDSAGPLLYVYGGIGSAYEESNELNKAIDYYNKAVGLRKGLISQKDKEYLANRYISLGNIYSKQGKYKTAIKLYEDSLQLELPVTIYNKLHALIMNNIGQTYYVQKNYKEAEKYLKNALTEKEKLYGKNSPELINSLKGLTKLEIAKGDKRKAQIIIDRINKIYKINDIRG